MVSLYGAAMEAARKAKVDHVLVSLSHCEDYATAQVVVTQDAE